MDFVPGTPFAKEVASCDLTHARNRKEDAMNMLLARDHWNIAKGKLNRKLTCLTEEELQSAEGELLDRIHKRKAHENPGFMSALGLCSTSHPQTS